MKTKKTARGFNYVEFTDSNGSVCTLQESSAVGASIWLGVTAPDVKLFVPKSDTPWQTLSEAEIKSLRPGAASLLINGRMYMTRQQVAALLPYLQKFVDDAAL